MHAQTRQHPVDAHRAEAEAIALTYRRAHRNDDRAALVAAITDALADLDAAERLTEARAHQVSRGYARAAVAGR